MKGDILVKKDTGNPIWRQDITMSINRFYFSKIKQVLVPSVKEVLDEICEQYVFQVEKTGLENYHFQVRVNLKNDRRWRCKQLEKHLQIAFVGNQNKAANLVEDIYFHRIHCTPTSNNAKSKFDYVMKEETRWDGPYSDRPIFLGKTILPHDKLLPWHRRFVDLLENYDTDEPDWRTIYHVKDERGCSMKSTFCRYLLWNYEKEVGMINPFGSPNQINSSITKMGRRKMFILDIPRSYSWTKKNKDNDSITRHYNPQWPELCLVLERLKDGMLIDSFYGRFESFIMDPPIILVFSNWPLERYPGQYLSSDRIKEVDLNSSLTD